MSPFEMYIKRSLSRSRYRKGRLSYIRREKKTRKKETKRAIAERKKGHMDPRVL